MDVAEIIVFIGDYSRGAGLEWFTLLDLWVAMGGTHTAFDRFVCDRSKADSWAQLTSVIRGETLFVGDTNPSPGDDLLELAARYWERRT